MGAFNYTKARKTAQRLVAKFADGGTVTLLKSDPRPADPDQPWKGSMFPHTGAGEGGDPQQLRLGPLPGAVQSYDVRQNPNEVARGSKMLVLAALDIEDLDADADVETFDAVREGDEVWQIKAVTPLQGKPAGPVISYTLEVGQ